MFKENVPIYEQIKEIIKGNIIKNVWKEGEKIPSVREFASELEVNPNTVMNALKDLQREGILENKRGIGNIIQDGVAKKISAEMKEEFCIVKLVEIIKDAKRLGISISEFNKNVEELWEEK